jgi:hypothetical protein
MTQEEIFEGNKLLAEFMGYTYKQRPKNNYFGFEEKCIELGDINIGMSKVKYHASWDWLIPVLNKIYFSEEYCKYKDFNSCLISDGGININTKYIINTWGEVVEFIKWYNQNKKE